MTENYDYNALLEYDNTNKIYNLFISTFNGVSTNINYFFFLCEKKHECRLDLVSNDIYNTTKWTGTLCQLNNMYHPHQVRNGDIIVYLSANDMNGLSIVPELYKQSEGVVSKAKRDLTNLLKKKKPDAVRKKFVDGRGEDILPPTVLPSTAPQIQVTNNKIKIAPDLYTNPNTTAKEVVTTTNPLTNEQDKLERVLIRQYIKTLND